VALGAVQDSMVAMRTDLLLMWWRLAVAIAVAAAMAVAAGCAVSVAVAVAVGATSHKAAQTKMACWLAVTPQPVVRPHRHTPRCLLAPAV